MKYLIAILTFCVSCNAAAAQFIPIGSLQDGFASVVTDMSADGRVLVGRSSGLEEESVFRWTPDGILRIGEDPEQGPLISEDGQTVVWQIASNYNQYSWTPASGTYLSDPTPRSDDYVPSFSHPRDYVKDISADGSHLLLTRASTHHFELSVQLQERTSPGTVINEIQFRERSLTTSGHAVAVSSNGSVITGRVPDPILSLAPLEYLLGDFAYIYSPLTEEYRLLGDLAGGGAMSEPTSISADGSTVVGYSDSSNGREAFLWMETTGMLGLGDLPGGIFRSRAADVSADGSVVVGSGSAPAGDAAFVWSESTGMLDLHELLLTQGVLGLDGWTLTGAVAVSDDGYWIAGNGINPAGYQEAFLANINPVPIPGGIWLFASGLFGILGLYTRKGQDARTGQVTNDKKNFGLTE